jgi:hypothetical protein
MSGAAPPPERGDVLEPDCEAASELGLAQGVPTGYTKLLYRPPDDSDVGADFDLGEWAEILTISEEAIDEFITAHAQTLLTAGGGWEGSEAPVQRAAAIARRTGLAVTSAGRPSTSADSDHDIAQTGAFAADLSNHPTPTPEMERTAERLSRALGVPDWRGGEPLEREAEGMRARLLWKVPGHQNHVHFGCRRVR